jgi:hypothetical protein
MQPDQCRGDMIAICSEDCGDLISTRLCGFHFAHTVIPLVFVGGVAYIAWYKKTVLDKVRKLLRSKYRTITDRHTLPLDRASIFRGL